MVDIESRAPDAARGLFNYDGPKGTTSLEFREGPNDDAP